MISREKSWRSPGNRWISNVWLSVLIWVPAAVALPDKLPPLILPDGVGVNVHFTTGHERDLDMIAAAGFKFVRMDFLWTRIEREKGKYDWSDYDAFTTELARHGLRPYYILDYSNPLYEKEVFSTNPVAHQVTGPVPESPQHSESVAAYARWAAAAAKHFRGHGVIWEIWNEPNISFWKPKPDVAQYTTLALATARAMRAADPQACIVGPTTSGFDWKFLKTVFKPGLLRYLNAVSVHPYRGGRPPETAGNDFTRLRELIARYAPPGRKIPILSGEWGYSSCTHGVSRKTQAEFAVRQQLSNLLNGVPISIWYDWKNDGRNPADNESNFGTVGYDLKPKPAYLAIQTLTRELSGYRIARRHETGNAADYVLVLTNATGAIRLAAWAIGKPHSVTFDARLKLKLDAMPQYISVGKAH